jgi:hypothetical protein
MVFERMNSLQLRKAFLKSHSGEVAFLRILSWQLLGLALLITAACSGPQKAAPPRAVAPPAGGDEENCQSNACVSRGEAQRILGFIPYEPTYVPQGFALYNRIVEPVPEGSKSNSVNLEYRINGSQFVPPLHIVEEVERDQDAVTLSKMNADCGEFITLDSGEEVFYAKGIGALRRGDAPNQFLVCPQTPGPPLAMSHVYMVRQNVIIQILGFPESGLNREELLKIAASMRQ